MQEIRIIDASLILGHKSVLVRWLELRLGVLLGDAGAVLGVEGVGFQVLGISEGEVDFRVLISDVLVLSLILALIGRRLKIDGSLAGFTRIQVRPHINKLEGLHLGVALQGARIGGDGDFSGFRALRSRHRLSI